MIRYRLFKKVFSVVFFCFLIPGFCFAENLYPRVERFDAFRDFNYRQILNDIETFYRNPDEFEPENLLFFTYKPHVDETIFQIAAAFNLSYDTLVSLNDLRSGEALHPETLLIIPNVPGLFVDTSSDSGFYELLRSGKREERKSFVVTVRRGQGKTFKYKFYPGIRFADDERSFFLGIMFRYPLSRFTISSDYGFRNDPINGKWVLHRGIDMKVNSGTDVRAAGEGIVQYVGYSKVYGNFILLEHGKHYITKYAHLKLILVKKGDKVTTQKVIGKSGNTGRSTAPHLHFEIIRDGKAVDPKAYTKGRVR